MNMPTSIGTSSGMAPPAGRFTERIKQRFDTEFDDLQNTRIAKLYRVVAEALKDQGATTLQSIFGPIREWGPPYDIHSELNVIDFWRPFKTLKYLIEVSVPAFSQAPDKFSRTLLPYPVHRLFWRPCYHYAQPGRFAAPAAFPREQWFFINGVATNSDMAQANAELLSEMFHRPITGVYNATNGFLLDLIECATDLLERPQPVDGTNHGFLFKLIESATKAVFRPTATAQNAQEMAVVTAPAYEAAQAIYHALRRDDIEKVVVIAHSQGTIVAASVLKAIVAAFDAVKAGEFAQGRKTPAQSPAAKQIRLREFAVQSILSPETLQRDSKEEQTEHFLHAMRKLEIYLFASCAKRLRYETLRDTSGDKASRAIQVPYIETFANENDVVARLGAVSRLRQRSHPSAESLIELDGPVYLNKEYFGHFLNAHYLAHIDAWQKQKRRSKSIGAEQENDLGPYRLDKTLTQRQGPRRSDHTRPRLYEYLNGELAEPLYAAQARAMDAAMKVSGVSAKKPKDYAVKPQRSARKGRERLHQANQH